MAKFLALANNNIYYGQFRMDYESGTVSYRSYLRIGEALPGTREISVLLQMTFQHMDDYGDGIAQISISSIYPDAAFQAAVDKQNWLGRHFCSDEMRGCKKSIATARERVVRCL